MRKSHIFCGLMFLIVMIFHSCKEKEGGLEPLQSIDYLNEDDYYKVQGIVLKSIYGFTYEKKFEKDIYYVYHLDLDEPIIGIEKKTELMLHSEEPIAVMVNKKDSTLSFIAHRGIIDEEILVDYLSRPDGNFDYLMSEQGNGSNK